MTAERANDWYLREWADYLGKRQADLVRDRGWLKSRASKFFSGEQPYRREVVNELAAWLGIAPYELLMSPEEAIALRKLREMAQIIATSGEPPPQAPKPSRPLKNVPGRTGTTG